VQPGVFIANGANLAAVQEGEISPFGRALLFSPASITFLGEEVHVCILMR
jgi:hypothetical protein